MNTLLNKAKWIAFGAAASLYTGAPAVLADDTDLFLLRPDGPTPKSNVLFIIDSSGSMKTEQSTRAIYDSSRQYDAGSGKEKCDRNMLYWTSVAVPPSCASSNVHKFKKGAFLCAASRKQLAALGRYTNVMAQFRKGGSSAFGLDKARWQTIEPGNEDDSVECAKDNGVHGDGSDSKYFAQKGGDVAPFTSIEKDAVAWGSGSTSQTITVWDGNYLNYLQNPTFTDMKRIDIVKNVAKVVLNAIENVNVGIMRFNDREGGAVIGAMTNLDSNRDDILATINAITVVNGATPLSETLFEAALYWRGLPAYYGERVNEHETDPNALRQSEPEIYRQPNFDVCAKNFNVILTDGEPNFDEDPPELVSTLPSWFDTLGYAGCTPKREDGNAGACLDDIAEYLYKTDLSNADGQQQVITHTIGFTTNLDILKETAERGRGSYFQANDIESLTLALLEIVDNVTDRSLAFAAPTIAVNAFNRTQNLNDLYLTTFTAQNRVRWPGNLKKYRIQNGVIVDKNGQAAVNTATGFFFDTAQSFWSSDIDGTSVLKGGAVESMPDPGARRLFTNNVSNVLNAPSNALKPDNDRAFTQADFGLTGSAEEPSIEALIRWARGEDVLNEDADPATTTRKFMGDSLHSQPAAVAYGHDVVVYSATNDGYVHAIDAATGEELWAFIPKELLPKLVKLYLNEESKSKNYGVDGDIVPVVMDRDSDGIIEPSDGDFVHILFGLRRGGSAYYSLDVSDRNNPKVNWRASTPESGQSWSRATVTRINMPPAFLSIPNQTDKTVLVIGGGYDPVHDTLAHPTSPDTQGAGLYMLDLYTGNVIWRAGADGGAQLTLDPKIRPGLSRAIPNPIRVIDLNGDGFADRMYASDLGGQILRFDIFNGKAPTGFGDQAMVTGGVIAQLGAEGMHSPSDFDTRRFYNAPDISMFNDNSQNRRFIAISVGSGQRARPLDNTVNDRFFSIRDRDVFNPLSQNDYNSYAIVTVEDLIEVAGTVGTAIDKSKRGWQFTLPANQKVLANSTTFNNEIFFVAFSPDNAAATSCSAGLGRNFLYRVSVINGDPIVNNRDNVVPGTEHRLRVRELAQGGIAPSPRFLFPSPDPGCTGDECTPPPLGCIGVQCFDPGFANNPVRTLWTQK